MSIGRLQIVYVCPNAANGEVVEAGDGGYLADGHTLTAEECAFLQSNLPPGKSAALDDDIL